MKEYERYRPELTIGLLGKYDIWYEDSIIQAEHETDDAFLERAKAMLKQLREKA